MKLTNKEVFEIHEACSYIAKNTKNFNLKVQAIKNRNVLADKVAELRELGENSEQYNEFERARIKLVSKYAVIDEKGNIVTEGDNAVIGDVCDFNTEYVELEKEYSEVLEKHKEKEDKLAEYLKDTVDIDLNTITESIDVDARNIPEAFVKIC